MTTRKRREKKSIKKPSSSPMKVTSFGREGDLALGKALVEALSADDRRDVSLRWMAHHLGGLICEAENGGTPDLRRAAAGEASEVALKLWKLRAQMPPSAYPLAAFAPVIEMVSALKGTRWQRGEGRNGVLSRLFGTLDELRRALIICSVPVPPVPKTEISKRLSRKEQQTLKTLAAIRQMFSSTAGDDPMASLEKTFIAAETALKEAREAWFPAIQPLQGDSPSSVGA
jgi:hypothetical protein